MDKPKIAWDTFKTELINHVGERRAQTIFSEQTGYSMTLMQWWRREGSVPGEAFDKIADIEIGACDSDRFKGYHSHQFGARVVALSNQNTPIKKIATMLSKEFNRKITEGAVKASRYRQKGKIVGYKTRGA